MKKVICVGHGALDRVFTVDAWPQGSAKAVAKAFAEGSAAAWPPTRRWRSRCV